MYDFHPLEISLQICQLFVIEYSIRKLLVKHTFSIYVYNNFYEFLIKQQNNVKYKEDHLVLFKDLYKGKTLFVNFLYL